MKKIQFAMKKISFFCAILAAPVAHL